MMKTSRPRICDIWSAWLLLFLFLALALERSSALNPPVLTIGISPMTHLTFSNLTEGVDYQLQRRFAWYWTNLPTSFTATNTEYSQLVTGVVQSADFRLAEISAPDQAFATAQVLNGSVIGVTITAGGSGYVNPPTVLFVHKTGTNATAVAEVSDTGSVTNIIIMTNGTRYTNAPTVRISAPPATASVPTSRRLMRLSVSDAVFGWRLQFSLNSGTTWQTHGIINTNRILDVAVTNDSCIYRAINP